MVGVLSNKGIEVQKKEGNPQPYLACMESVHHDKFTLEDLWTGEASTDHYFHSPFVMARAPCMMLGQATHSPAVHQSYAGRR